MITQNLPPRPVQGESTLTYGSGGSYLDWPAIIAGGVFALAISFLLVTFGAGLGLSLTSPYRGEGMSGMWFVIAAGIWFAWVMVTAFGAGGYLAGRMRRRAGDATADEVEVRDGAHGLVVWATGAVVSSILAASGVSGLVSAGAGAVGSAAATVTEVAADAASSDYFANVMLRNSADLPLIGENAAEAPTNDAPAPAGGGDTQLPADGGDTAAPASGAEAGAAPRRQPAQQATDVMGADPAVRREIAGILLRSAASGEMADRDRSHLARLVAANSDLDAAAARARVENVLAEIEDARAAALAAADKARVALVLFGFIAAATLLIGAVAAFHAAAAGGRHRDEGLGWTF